jgi:hypothetical protein
LLATWLLFSNLPVKIYILNTQADWPSIWVSLYKKCVPCYIIYYPWLLATWMLLSKPPNKLYPNTIGERVLDVSLFVQETCLVAGYLTFIFKPACSTLYS